MTDEQRLPWSSVFLSVSQPITTRTPVSLTEWEISSQLFPFCFIFKVVHQV